MYKTVYNFKNTSHFNVHFPLIFRNPSHCLVGGRQHDVATPLRNIWNMQQNATFGELLSF